MCKWLRKEERRGKLPLCEARAYLARLGGWSREACPRRGFTLVLATKESPIDGRVVVEMPRHISTKALRGVQIGAGEGNAFILTADAQENVALANRKCEVS